MATRPVFLPAKRGSYVDTYMTEFVWNKGLAASQKRKNVAALHEAFARRFPQRRILEISSKSTEAAGVALSAFNLKKYVPSLGRSIPLECVYHGGKVFTAGGPYTDLYTASPKEAKRDPRLRASGALKSFYFEGQTIPAVPSTAFYNWLYINALMENPELAETLLEYDGFTDIEFNPDKSINCQARSAALFLNLSRKGTLERCRDFEEFRALCA
ncbi:MAG: hypothetical protein IJC58_07405 [Oscillospiraceae bacterium]|nr:hypothetical protein [Oscillospiraceae bacterium]